jgi:hypothetical protein
MLAPLFRHQKYWYDSSNDVVHVYSSIPTSLKNFCIFISSTNFVVTPEQLSINIFQCSRIVSMMAPTFLVCCNTSFKG